MKTRIWIVLAGVAIGAIVIWAFYDRLTATVEVKAAKAQIGPISAYVDERAKTRLPETHLVTMPFDGRISPIALAEGDAVKEGDVVARIVDEDLDLALAAAEAHARELGASIVENADEKLERTAWKSTVEMAQSMISSAKAAEQRKRSGAAQRQYAISDLKRVQRLHKTKAVSDDDLEQATLRQTQSDADYWQDVLVYSAMTSLQAATDLMPKMVLEYIDRKGLRGTVLKAQKELADVRVGQAQLDKTRGSMTSPVDGVVLERKETNERVLPSGTVLLEIGRLADLEVEADVLSFDAGKIRRGAAVEIYGPAVGHPAARGTVQRVYPGGFTKISSLGVEQQRVKVIVRFRPEDLERLLSERNLGVGYRVRVKIFTDRKPQALTIPRSAAFRGAGSKWYAYVIRNGRARLQELELGLQNDDLVEVIKGLKQAEQVVLAPESDLADNTRVKSKRGRESF